MSRQMQKRAIGKVLLLLLCGMMFSVTLSAATVVVTSEDNMGPGSLRQAILDAESGDIITFDQSVTTVSLSSAIPLNKNLIIDGLNTTITAMGKSPLFVTLFSPVHLQLKNLTLSNAAPAICCTPCCTIDLVDSTLHGCIMGAISNSGTMNLENCTLHTNSAEGQGGAITSCGMMNLSNCTLYENSSNASGGAVLNYGHMVLTDCVLSQNSASDKGGGIACFAPITLRNSVVVANSALYGPDCYGTIMSDGKNMIADASFVKGLLPTDKSFVSNFILFDEFINTSMQLYVVTPFSKPDDTHDALLTSTYMKNVKEILKPLCQFEMLFEMLFDMPYEDQKAYFSKLYDLEALFNLNDEGVKAFTFEESKTSDDVAEELL